MQDVLLMDVTRHTLRSEISPLSVIPYLASRRDPLKTNGINGCFFEDNHRVLIPSVVKNSAEACWVIILDTGSPQTVLSAYVSATESHPRGLHYSRIDLILGVWFAHIVRVSREIPVCLYLWTIPRVVDLEISASCAATFVLVL